MNIKNIHRLVFGGMIALFVILLAVPGATAQSTGDDDPDKGEPTPTPDPRHHDTTVNFSVPSYIPTGRSDTISVYGEVEIGQHTITASASGSLGFGSNCNGPNPYEGHR